MSLNAVPQHPLKPPTEAYNEYLARLMKHYDAFTKAEHHSMMIWHAEDVYSNETVQGLHDTDILGDYVIPLENQNERSKLESLMSLVERFNETCAQSSLSVDAIEAVTKAKKSRADIKIAISKSRKELNEKLRPRLMLYNAIMYTACKIGILHLTGHIHRFPNVNHADQTSGYQFERFTFVRNLASEISAALPMMPGRPYATVAEVNQMMDSMHLPTFAASAQVAILTPAIVGMFGDFLRLVYLQLDFKKV